MTQEMKSQIVLFTVASVGLIMGACAKNDPQITIPVEEKTESIAVDRGMDIHAVLQESEPDTKLTFSEETDLESKIYLASQWSAGDAFSISPDASSSSDVSVFELSSGAGTKSGRFHCDSPSAATSTTWTVYYPSTITCDAEFDSFDFSSQTQHGNDNTGHLSALNIMRKQITFDAASPIPSEVSFSGENFKQSSCLKLTLSNFPTSIVPESLNIEFYTYVVVNYSGGAQQYVKEPQYSQEMSLDGIGSTTEFTAYMMLPPQTIESPGKTYMKVQVNGEGGAVMVTERNLSGSLTLEEGKYHRIVLKKNWYLDTGINGSWGTFQEPSAGDITTPNCNIIIMGDGYTAGDYGVESKFLNDATVAYNGLFSEEPFKGLKDYFGVYYVNVVSGQPIHTTGTYTNGAQNTDTGTPFSLSFTPNSTKISGDERVARYYAQKVSSLSLAQISKAVIVVLANLECHAGTCTVTYGHGTDYCQDGSLAYVALGNPGEGQSASFKRTFIHEVGGHGFGKLADEYTKSFHHSDLPSAQNKLLNMQGYGIYKNVSPYSAGVTTIDVTPWSSLASVAAYGVENIGVYDGAYAVSVGFCRSTPGSFMNGSSAEEWYFNAISRKMIYYRAMRLSGKTAEDAEGSFATWDSAHLPDGGVYSSTKSLAPGVMLPELLPLAEPVLRFCQ